jgi:quinol monooxygenase YgiN
VAAWTNGCGRNLQMVSKYVTYKIEPDQLELVLEAVKSFVSAIKENEPDTYYAAYQQSDEVSFMHVMKFADRAAEQKHSSADYTLAFVDVLYPNCSIRPVFYNISELAST